MSKKEKLLASAQKNLLKGQIGKAITDYEKIIQSDGKDIRNRQKLAELYSRANLADKALETYEGVAKHYEDNGFFLKALAVFKQMQKVDADRPQTYQRLAELNIKQGLVGNALCEYRNLVALHRRQGDLVEAVKVLDSMKSLDPDNLAICLQVAEGYSQSEQPERACECLMEVLQRCTPNADLATVEKVEQAALSSSLASSQLKVALARAFIACGQNPRGIALVEELLAAEPRQRDAMLLLADGYHGMADYVNEMATCRTLLETDPDNLELQRRHVVALLAGGEAQRAFTALEAVRQRFIEDDRAAELKGLYEQIAEQLPGNDQVQAALQVVYEHTGDGGKLFDLMSSQEGETVVGGADGSEAADSAGSVSFDELDLADDAPVSTAAGEDLAGFQVVPESQDDTSTPLGIDAAQAGGFEFDDLDLDGIEFDLAEGDTAEESGPDSAPDEPAADLDPARSAVNVASELEEAEFYLQQGLLEEAERKCQLLLEQVRDCPQAEELLARIAADGAGPATEVDVVPAGSDGAASSATGAVQGLQDRERSRLDGSLSEFKKGLENEVSAEDTETHYNLGIAYKEMGLLDDAIEQFDKVMADPHRRIDCLTLKGVCLVQKGAFDDAAATFKEGLGDQALTEGERISLYYELGLLYMGWGQPLEALDSFQCVADVDPFFRSVDEQIRQLRKELGLDDDGGETPSGNGSDKDRVSYI